MSYQLSSIKESIQATVSSFGRLVLIGSTAFGIASYANFGHHKSYWNGTIERVQTVDFNMLSHMLPTKLSQALIEGNDQEIQRTLDSNYGLFGLVVTDCQTSQPDCSQNIQYVSSSKLPWIELLNDATLSASTYDVLRDPPPIYPTGSYADSRDPIRHPTGLENTGEIIGRVYYVRGTPPSFLSAYPKWIKAWPASFQSDSGPNRYYSLTTSLFGVGGLSAWIFMELGFAKRRKHAVQLALGQAKLLKEAQGLRQQLQEKLAENARLIEERSRSLAELAEAQRRYQSQEARLQNSFQNLKGKLANQDQGYKEEKQRQTHLQMEIREQQRAVELLEKEIVNLKSQDIEGKRTKQLTTEKVARLMKEQEEKQRQIEQHASELNQLWQELKLQTEAREEQARLAEVLSEQIEESKRQQASASRQSIELRGSLHLIEQEREIDKQKIKALETELKDKKSEGDALKAVIDDINPNFLNLFEGRIVSTLKKDAKVQSATWSVHTQLDLSPRTQNSASMVADCIVVGNSFVAVIEAKNYSGKIYAEGDTLNSKWRAKDRKKCREISSCWGDNPYKQVTTYVHGAMGLIGSNLPRHRKNICKDVSFYGVVVFPDDADLSALDPDLRKHYRVSKISDLLDVLHQLERQTHQSPQKGEKRLSAAEIANCLYGRPHLKSVA